MAELRARLRNATAALHEQVDSAYAGFGFDQPGNYGRFLRAHSRVLGSMEIALEQAGIAELLDDWPTRTRRHALQADLHELDIKPPVSLPALELPDAANCWGAAYVLEGSRLGGRVLAQRVLQIDPAAPVRYLQHGEVAQLWPRFLARLESVASPSAWPAMLAAAEQTFALFIAAALERDSAGR